MGELLPIATTTTKGLQSADNYKKQGRKISAPKGPKVYKLSSFSNHYTHYSAILHIQAPASQMPGMYEVISFNTYAYATLMGGIVNNTVFYKGTNPSSNEHEFYVKLTNTTDVVLNELSRIGGLDTFEEVSDIPSYCSEVEIKNI